MSKSRIELFLEAMRTGNISNLPKPQSRVEHFLKGIATGDISSLPKPQSRIEECLEYIARNGSSSGGGGNNGNDYTLYNITAQKKIKPIILDILGILSKIEEKVIVELKEV